MGKKIKDLGPPSQATASVTPVEKVQRSDHAGVTCVYSHAAEHAPSLMRHLLLNLPYAHSQDFKFSGHYRYLQHPL